MKWFWKSLAWLGAASSTFFIFAILAPSFLGFTYSAPVSSEAVEDSDTVSADSLPAATHLNTPEPLKALYMTSCVTATPSLRQSLKELVEATELNAVVIDIKDYTGVVSFPNNFPKSDVGRGCVVSDIQRFVHELHEKNIYVIGRISVFQDLSYVKSFPELAVKKINSGEVWRDHKGLTFVDVGARLYWDYIVEISKRAYELGFDELNFDYVRYPSDGNMEEANYTWSNASSTKADMLENFFSYLSDNLKSVGVVTSVDIFGMTTTASHDLGIGQIFEKTLPYFDYVSPMVYPSHYPAGWNGFANPAEHPYEVVKISMGSALAKEQNWLLSNNLATSTTSKLRAWLQDFNLGATYDAEKVRAQIQAAYDTGLTSWMLWNAGNTYTREALLEN